MIIEGHYSGLLVAIVKDTICLTVSAGECRSMTRLCILISYRSHVLLPSPQGVLRQVMFNFFVGIRIGPFTLNPLSLAPRIRSLHTRNVEWKLI